MARYIVEETGGNPALFIEQSNGSYKKLAFGAGSDSLGSLIELANEANTIWED